MVNPELLNYVRGQIGAGVPRDQIKKALATGGWTEEDANGAFFVIDGVRTYTAPPAPPSPPPLVPTIGVNPNYHPQPAVAPAQRPAMRPPPVIQQQPMAS